MRDSGDLGAGLVVKTKTARLALSLLKDCEVDENEEFETPFRRKLEELFLSGAIFA